MWQVIAIAILGAPADATYYGTYDYSVVQYQCLSDLCDSIEQCDQTQYSTLSQCAGNLPDRETEILVRKRWFLGPAEYCSARSISSVIGLDLWPLLYEGLSISNIVDDQPIVLSDVTSECGDPIPFQSATKVQHTDTATPECSTSRWSAGSLPKWDEALEFDSANKLMYFKKSWFSDETPLLLVASFASSSIASPAAWCNIHLASTTRAVLHTDEIVKAKDIPYDGTTTRPPAAGGGGGSGGDNGQATTRRVGWEASQAAFPRDSALSAISSHLLLPTLLAWFFSSAF